MTAKVANGRPTGETTSARLVTGLPAGPREFLLYLPLYNGTRSLEIGVPEGRRLEKPPARPQSQRKPIAVEIWNGIPRYRIHAH